MVDEGSMEEGGMIAAEYAILTSVDGKRVAYIDHTAVTHTELTRRCHSWSPTVTHGIPSITYLGSPHELLRGTNGGDRPTWVVIAIGRAPNPHY